MSDLIAFLNARLAEDEAYLKSNRHPLWTQRPFRDVAAHRTIISIVLQYEAKIDGEWGDCHDAEAIGAGLCPDTPPGEIPALRALAAIYDDHPDYRQEWALPLTEHAQG